MNGGTWTLTAAVCLGLAPAIAAGAVPAVVAIDAGHGGEDRGGVVHGKVEAEIVLAISKKVAAALKGAGAATPFLTRWSDEFVPLTDRVLRAEQIGAKAFVSIHADKVYRKRPRGVVVFVYGRNPRIPKGPPRAPGERILPPPPAGQIASSRGLGESIRLSVKMEGLRTVEYVDRGGYAVLKSSVIPSVLIEVGNLRDKKEARRLAHPRHQERLARAIARGIGRFLER